jgi:hypothetical protein
MNRQADAKVLLDKLLIELIHRLLNRAAGLHHVPRPICEESRTPTVGSPLERTDDSRVL